MTFKKNRKGNLYMNVYTFNHIYQKVQSLNYLYLRIVTKSITTKNYSLKQNCNYLIFYYYYMELKLQNILLYTIFILHKFNYIFIYAVINDPTNLVG